MSDMRGRKLKKLLSSKKNKMKIPVFQFDEKPYNLVENWERESIDYLINNLPT